ncbi:hypothetical protein TNCV_588411 [Trichonephila clavipes]|nr:hypothetical protein TNCV_588411 [Trichonephila clavipes]
MRSAQRMPPQTMKIWDDAMVHRSSDDMGWQNTESHVHHGPNNMHLGPDFNEHLLQMWLDSARTLIPGIPAAEKNLRYYAITFSSEKKSLRWWMSHGAWTGIISDGCTSLHVVNKGYLICLKNRNMRCDIRALC